MSELEVKVPPAELVDVGSFKVDNENPNRMSPRRLEALKKSIQRYGFVVPIITNKDLIIADGEHRLKAAKALGMKQVSVVRLPVDEVDRRLIRQVMNKLRGEHDLFLDAEEYYRIVCGDKRDLLKQKIPFTSKNFWDIRNLTLHCSISRLNELFTKNNQTSSQLESPKPREKSNPY